jgi:hypothetical protein
MKLIDIWKAVSIVLTGAFGILGLLTDFKDQNTKKITKWGRISLAGIVITTLLGAAAQLKESHDDGKEALELAENSKAQLEEIERVLTPIDQIMVRISVSGPCEEPSFAHICKTLSRPHVTVRDLLTSGQFKNAMSFTLHFYKTPEYARAALNNIPVDADLKLWAIPDDKTTDGYVDNDQLLLDMYEIKPHFDWGTGNIEGLEDIRKASLLVWINEQAFRGFAIQYVNIRVPNRRFVIMGECTSYRRPSYDTSSDNPVFLCKESSPKP